MEINEGRTKLQNRLIFRNFLGRFFFSLYIMAYLIKILCDMNIKGRLNDDIFSIAEMFF